MQNVEKGRSYCVGATNSWELRFYTYNIKVLRSQIWCALWKKIHVASNGLNSSILMQEKIAVLLDTVGLC